MIDIPIKNLGDMPCYDQAVACYASVHNRRYEMLFAGSWGFEYREEASAEKIGERIKSRAVLNMNYLKRYHGIEIIKKEVKVNENLLDILEEEIDQGNPVMIFISTYYFPWNEHYKKFENNLPHAMLAVGVDREKECIYCVDCMLKKQNVPLSFDDLLNGNNGKYWTIRCLPDYDKEIDVEEVFNYSINKLKRNTQELKDIQDIMRLADAMRQGFDLKKEIDNTHGGIWIEPIIFNLGGIMADRANFVRLIDFILEQKEDYNIRRVKENMEKITLEWNQIRGMLLKGYFLTNADNLVKKVIDRLERTASLEENTVQLIENWKEKKEIYIKNKEAVDIKEPDQITFVPIKNYYNNQSFGIYNEKQSVANIDGMRYFFYVDETVNKEIWELRRMKFYHEPIKGKQNDSIKCYGQTIAVASNDYDCIMLMGYGDLSSFEEEIEIQYKDDTSIMVSIEVPDSAIPNPFIKNTMIWNGRCGFIDEIEEHAWDVGIYAMLYRIERKALKAIKLPICPNIVLFAISLGKYE